MNNDTIIKHKPYRFWTKTLSTNNDELDYQIFLFSLIMRIKSNTKHIFHNKFHYYFNYLDNLEILTIILNILISQNICIYCVSSTLTYELYAP